MLLILDAGDSLILTGLLNEVGKFAAGLTKSSASISSWKPVTRGFILSGSLETYGH
jgi:hypothetical protein